MPKEVEEAGDYRRCIGDDDSVTNVEVALDPNDDGNNDNNDNNDNDG